MKRLLSYVWPFTKKITSTHNGTLEVTLVNGRKLLDTEHANYSYGNLHKILEIGLKEMQIEKTSEVLVLGLGGGSIIELLRKKASVNGKITAVEIDPSIIELASYEFNILQYQPLQVICDDALHFVEAHSKQYGCAIVDLFIDTLVPQQFFSLLFWKQLSKLLKPESPILFNAGIKNAHEKEIKELLQEISPFIHFTQHQHVLGTNTLLIGTKI